MIFNMTISNFIFTLISSMFQHIVIISCALYFIHPERKLLFRPISFITYILSWIPCIFIQLNNNNWVLLSYLFISIIFSTSIYIISKTDFIHSFFSFFITYFIIMITNVPFIFIILLFFPHGTLVYSGLASLFSSIGSALLILIIIKSLPLRKFFNILCKIPLALFYFFLIGFTFLAILCDLHKTLTYISPYLPYMLIISLIFISALLFISQFYSNQKNIQAVHYYKQYLPILDNLINQVRNTQHGHNNLIQSLVNLTEIDMEPEKISLLLKKYTSTIKQSVMPSSLLTLENKLLSALIYHKLCQCEEHGITLNISIKDTLCTTSASEFEVIDAVGILLDNAIESSQQNDTIYITIASKETAKKSHMYITVDNPGPTVTNDYIHTIFSKGYSTKSDTNAPHGLGLHILKSLAKKNHGSITVSNTSHDDDKQYISFELII